MAQKLTTEQAYARGCKAAEAAQVDPNWLALAESVMAWCKVNYPCSEELDYRSEMLTIEKARLGADLDLTKFPECRGLRELVEAEHDGFLDTCGDPWMTAHQFNWDWFVSRRLNTRYVGAAPPAGNCTGVFIRDSAEGPLVGSNLDDILRPFDKFSPPKKGPSGEPFKGITCIRTVSSAVLCDDEPDDIFPVDPLAILPDDITKLDDFVSYMERYHDFWGPHNSIWVDADFDSVVFEKANCRMGVRKSLNGASATTACSYLIPEMNRFHKERGKASIAARGWAEDCCDAVYWQGCEKRYERLLQLVADEVARGATFEGVRRIVLDHDVPFPDRICLAGESSHPEENSVNWTLTSHTSALLGPTRRTLWSRAEGETAAYDTVPFLVLGKGVEMREEWREGTREA
jgi:hypothetical protein